MRMHLISWQEIKQQEWGLFFLFFSCYEVHFKAIDLPLGNMFCSLTGPGNDAMSPVMFPFQTPSASLCLTLPLCVLLSVSDASQRHRPGARSTGIQMQTLVDFILSERRRRYSLLATALERGKHTHTHANEFSVVL